MRLRWSITPYCNGVRPNSPTTSELLATHIWWKRRAMAVGISYQGGSAVPAAGSNPPVKGVATEGRFGIAAASVGNIMYSDHHYI
jgi:hypothetical protein